MTIVMSGGTGFVGSELFKLIGDNHTCIAISRNPDRSNHEISWKHDELVEAFQKADVLIHASGQSIAGGLWTSSYKKKLYASRVEAGKKLKAALEDSGTKLKKIIQFSGIGFYGHRGEELLSEDSSGSSGFMEDLARDWEAVLKDAKFAEQHHVLRIGLVIGDGGLLAKMKWPTMLGLGTSFGNGKQFHSWISVNDLVRGIGHIINHGQQPIYNLVSPEPIRAKAFYKSIAKAYHRPLFLTIPSFLLKLLPGGMGNDIFLASQRVVPKALLSENFEFEDTDLVEAIRGLRTET